MNTTNKHSFPRYILSVRLFPASKAEISSNHWNKQTVEICSQHAGDTFVIRSLFCSISINYRPLRSGRIWHKVNFWSGVYQVWIQSFPSPRLVASPRMKNLVCPTILPIAGGRIIGYIPFPRVLVLCEMQSVSSRIWTRVAVSISCDDN